MRPGGSSKACYVWCMHEVPCLLPQRFRGMARGLWCSRRQTESTCKDPSPGAAYLYTPSKDTCVGGGGGDIGQHH